ncbi:hypothetical protein KKE26_10270 [bacterium]|nr:hypothetical protein [bacterium]MBU1752390.1 hypothetical protein [bacterium]
MKTMKHVMGIENIKNMHSIGARSIPKVDRSSCLDLYVLRKEKDRLEKEIFTLDKKRVTTKRQLDNLNKQIERIQEETYERRKDKTCGNVPARPLKRMAVTY